MSGRRAAFKLATRNARRNRKRTIFLVLLVAVPVGFGVVMAGVVRASSSLSLEESVQTTFGAADARVQLYAPVPGVSDWVHSTAGDVSSDTTITELRQAAVRLPGAGFTLVWDLDPSDPVVEGYLLLLDGRAPQAQGEVAISPVLANRLQLKVGDVFDPKAPPLGAMEIVGLISHPFSTVSSDILIPPGGLVPLVDSTEILVETSLLLSGPGAEEVARQVRILWSSEGRQLFLPNPAVDPKPSEIEYLDDQMYLLLTKAEIMELVDLVQKTRDSGGDAFNAARQLADEMVYGSGRPRGLPDIYVDIRTEWFTHGSGTGQPGLISTGASALLLVEVAFITGAAFAAGTRRRLREIGLMGANGASDKHIRTTVLGEGLSIAVVGALAGVLAGIGVLVLARPLLQHFVSKVILGVGVRFTDVIGPVAVAIASVLLAVWIPARTASKVPTITALQGRMPALSPRKWVVTVGMGCAAFGSLLVLVSLASSNEVASVLVGVGAVLLVGGVAMLTSPILAWVGKLANQVPAASRLVVRDSGRNRTRSSVAVAATMVILLAPITAVTVVVSDAEKDLVFGLPSPTNHLVLRNSIGVDPSDTAEAITESDVLAVAAIVPATKVSLFDTLDLRVVTNEILEMRELQPGDSLVENDWVEGNDVAVASEDLLAAFGDPGVADSIGTGEIVVLGIEDKPTRVSLNGREYPAHEYPIAVVSLFMPRVLIPESMVAQFSDTPTQPLALLILERSPTDDEYNELSSLGLAFTRGGGQLSERAVYLIAGVASVLMVLIVVALVTAVSAAEVDDELRTIVAVGAPGAFRRRFLGLRTGYQTLVAMLLAVPLGIALVWVFRSAQDFIYVGPFGPMQVSTVTVPWAHIAVFAVALPLVVGILTMISVRSAPVTPPRRAS